MSELAQLQKKQNSIYILVVSAIKKPNKISSNKVTLFPDTNKEKVQ